MMIAFIIKRFFWLLVTLWAVFTVSFILMRSVPGGPFDREKAVAPEIKRNLERRYNLDKPVLVQYGLELERVFLHGDLGHCMNIADASVNFVIRQGLPISAALGILAMTFAVSFGVLTGVVAAAMRGSPLDVGLRLAATAGIALPNFVVAGVCILLFVFWLSLLPAAGWGSLSQLVLPAFCLGAPYAAEVARISRTSMLDALSHDYIRTARAKGVSRTRVVLVHGLRNSLLPVVSFLGPAVAGILTGSLIVEQIFGIPGLGVYFVKSALQRDYTLSMGVVLLYTLVLYTMNFLVDLSYAYLDPRVELE
ncbi:ABC transporter permease [Lacipirellula limnantheis]|uniref:Dipeptide transport system permease protein DppB n=1 Tax=Lacipirellula limnantheis TaxID=2528024 RepID=A0A517TW36_9BACT|nr:ABC transporter permease [Lacipirellula limnantheis]QDT72580.1 Dipeptide transport system permease protein DppB [Lacipirellula limnantheis]